MNVSFTDMYKIYKGMVVTIALLIGVICYQVHMSYKEPSTVTSTIDAVESYNITQTSGSK